jgi:thiamine biosynthesis protein ThiS
MMEKKQPRIHVNGESRSITDQLTLSELVEELSLSPARIAVELNGEVVRRDDWSETVLSEGDRLEVVHFVGGG